MTTKNPTLIPSNHEARLRRFLTSAGYTLKKTPARHWTRAPHGEGYTILNDRNSVEIGCHTREYEATLEDVEAFVADLCAEVVKELAATPPASPNSGRRALPARSAL
jgi:hypothetical protein